MMLRPTSDNTLSQASSWTPAGVRCLACTRSDPHTENLEGLWQRCHRVSTPTKRSRISSQPPCARFADTGVAGTSQPPVIQSQLWVLSQACLIRHDTSMRVMSVTHTLAPGSTSRLVVAIRVHLVTNWSGEFVSSWHFLTFWQRRFVAFSCLQASAVSQHMVVNSTHCKHQRTSRDHRSCQLSLHAASAFMNGGPYTFFHWKMMRSHHVCMGVLSIIDLGDRTSSCHSSRHVLELVRENISVGLVIIHHVINHPKVLSMICGTRCVISSFSDFPSLLNRRLRSCCLCLVVKLANQPIFQRDGANHHPPF